MRHVCPRDGERVHLHTGSSHRLGDIARGGTRIDRDPGTANAEHAGSAHRFRGDVRFPMPFAWLRTKPSDLFVPAAATGTTSRHVGRTAPNQTVVVLDSCGRRGQQDEQVGVCVQEPLRLLRNPLARARTPSPSVPEYAARRLGTVSGSGLVYGTRALGLHCRSAGG